MKKICLIAVLGMMPMLATAAQAATPAANAHTFAAKNWTLAAVGAPEPSSIGILAAGAVGLLMRRRKQG